MKVGLIFGGKTNEHDVSIKSCYGVYSSINKEKYEVSLIYLDKENEFYSVDEVYFKQKRKIENVFDYLKSFNVLFPATHGKYSEDGSLEGFLDIIGVAYVGCKVISSSICMDKVYTKMLLEKSGFNVAKYEVVKYNNGKIIYTDKTLLEKIVSIDEIDEILKDNLGYPVYVKPASSGSSVGISKVLNKDELLYAIKKASVTDFKILIEEEIIGRELECAVLESNELILGEIGEVVIENKFYDYDKKYNSSSINTVVPANLPKNIELKAKDISKKVFKLLSCSGISRVDLFLKDDVIYVNEINTMPGFTDISMYPKLLNEVGIRTDEIIDILIKKASK